METDQTEPSPADYRAAENAWRQAEADQDRADALDALRRSYVDGSRAVTLTPEPEQPEQPEPDDGEDDGDQDDAGQPTAAQRAAVASLLYGTPVTPGTMLYRPGEHLRPGGAWRNY